MRDALGRLRELLWISVVLSVLLAACAQESVQADVRQPGPTPAAVTGAPLVGAASDYDPLLQAVGEARFVLLGESTHGTSEFYRERARITERLVRERGVLAVAIESDWPEADRLNRYVRGMGADRSVAEALADFRRFPQWMWRNAEFAAFVEALRTHNMQQPPERRVGLYGMDVQNLSGGTAPVIAWLQQADPAAAARARSQYGCLTRYRDARAYGEATQRGRSCEKQAAAVLTEIQRRPRPSHPAAAEAHFSALRNAAGVASAEAYFRASYSGAYSWNLRDQRMADNVAEIAAHAETLSGQPGKVVIWAHNTHVGDARATEMAQRGELNLGQLLRDRHGERAFLLGFLTHGGTVMAAPEWDAPGRVYALRPAISESYAGVLHSQGLTNSLLLTRSDAAVAAALAGPRLERAVGVIYQPDAERVSHYFQARLSRQFDAVVYLDRTRAVTPLKG